jgi:hypothetical protein
MKNRWLAILACLLFAACNGPEPGKDAAKKNTESNERSVIETNRTKLSESENNAADQLSPSEQYLAIKARYENAMSDYRVAASVASAEQRSNIMRQRYRCVVDYGNEFLAIAENYPNEKVAFDSLYWVAKNVGIGETADRACELLLLRHIDNERLKEVFLGRATPGPVIESRLNQLIDRSPHDSVKAHATYALASYYSRLEETRQRISDQTDDHGYDEATVKYLLSHKLDEEAIERLYRSLIDNYPELKPTERSRKTYKSLAECALFELANLAIGKIAPDIEGADLDGKTFQLSQYRGKVVVIDFWGDW